MPTPDTLAYRRAELNEIGSPEDLKLKITATGGATKWLNISPEEFTAIRALLTETTDDTVSVEARVRAAIAYINAVRTPNHITLDHIRTILLGERDAFVRLWEQEYPADTNPHPDRKVNH